MNYKLEYSTSKGMQVISGDLSQIAESIVRLQISSEHSKIDPRIREVFLPKAYFESLVERTRKSLEKPIRALSSKKRKAGCFRSISNLHKANPINIGLAF